MMSDALLKDLKELGAKKGISCIIMFGSFARGEEDARSDVDICVIMVQDDRNLKESIGDGVFDLEKKHDKNIQVIFTTPSFNDIDRTLLENIVSEGMIVSGTLPPVSIQVLDLEPNMIIKFDLHELPASKKMRIKRLLYGQTTNKKYKNKSYQSIKQGLVEKLGAERIGIASVMVKQHLAREITTFLEHQGATYRTLRVWVSKA